MAKRSLDDCAVIAVKSGGSWVEFPDEAMQGLQKAYVRGQDVVEVVIQTELDADSPSRRLVVTKYIVDFGAMKQTNTYTKRTHELRFIKKLKGKLKEIVIPPGVPSSIAEKDERKPEDCGNLILKLEDGWVEYPDDVFERLQFSYLHGYDLVEFEIDSGKNQTKYFVNFATMKQTNPFNAQKNDISFTKKREKMEGTLMKPVGPVRDSPRETPRETVKQTPRETVKQTPRSVDLSKKGNKGNKGNSKGGGKPRTHASPRKN